MDGRGFVKLCKEKGLLIRPLTVTDADMVFAAVRKAPRKTISFNEFCVAIAKLVERSQVRGGVAVGVGVGVGEGVAVRVAVGVKVGVVMRVVVRFPACLQTRIAVHHLLYYTHARPCATTTAKQSNPFHLSPHPQGSLPSFAKVMLALGKMGGPESTGTVGEPTKLYDNKEMWTGVALRGGPSTVGSGNAF